jgi:TolB protein
MPIGLGLDNGFNSPFRISKVRLFFIATFFLLILSACSPSPAAPQENISDAAPQPAGLVEPTKTPKNQISFPTLIPTKTLLPAVTETPSPTSIPNYRNSIVFVSDRDGDKEIYRVDADGSDFIRLTENFADDSSPQWSYDKTRILFLSSAGASNHLYTINPQGDELVNLTPDTAVSQCAWSPATYLIACIALGADATGNDLVIIDPDDGLIDTAFSAGGVVLDLDWSPDGRKIALAAEHVAGILVYDLARDSLEVYELGEGLTRNVTWSHNGNRLAYSFAPRTGGAAATLYTVKTDFTNPRKLILRGGPDWVQSFSPGDVGVLLESSRLGHSEIFVYDLVARKLIQLTNTEGGEENAVSANGSPVYSRDGRRIAYVSIQEGQSDIYLMNSDGTRQRNLTDHPAADGEPDW